MFRHKSRFAICAVWFMALLPVTLSAQPNHQTGTFTAFSAAASGDVVGLPVGGGTPAQLGTNHLVNIDISH